MKRFYNGYFIIVAFAVIARSEATKNPGVPERLSAHNVNNLSLVA